MRIIPILPVILVGIVLAVPATADEAQRCGTPKRLEPGAAAAAAAPAARPAPGTFQLGSTHFIVHYNDAALDAYAQDVSDASERAWRVLVDTLGYDVPPSDGSAGGDARVDVYLQPPAAMSGAWGTTTPETFTGSPYAGSWTAYVEIVDTLSLDRRLVVTAHEFFHVIHVGYDRNEQVSFLEMISTWAEDRVYDDANLYLEVLPGFFSQPQRNLYSFVYSNVAWMIFLTERYGDDILHDIMGFCAATTGANATAATNSALAPHGSSEIDEFTVFTLWNFFTGARDDGNHYSEGASFPLVSIEKRTGCYPLEDYLTIHKMGRVGANYFFFDGNGSSDALRLDVVPEWRATSVFTVHRFKGGAVETESFTTPPMTPADSLTVTDWSQCDSLLVICHIQSTTENLNGVTISAAQRTRLPPTDPYLLVLDRDGCREPFDGIGDDFAPRDGEEAPLTTAITALGFRALQSDSIPGDLGQCGGVFLVAGHDGSGATLTDDEFDTLSAFMDAGGDVYVEGNELGRWIDPTRGAGTAAANAFWSRFGCDFAPGNAAAIGNVSQWQTAPGAPLPAMTFLYDYQDDPDDNVGELTPTAADTLALDQSGAVRMTLHSVSGSARIMSTVLLGGSTGAGATRAEFVDAVIDLFDSIVATLSVQAMALEPDGGRVRIAGEVTGYDGETLHLRRAVGTAVTDVPLEVTADGSRAIIEAVDDAVDAEVVYRLSASTAGGTEWVLWQQSYDGRLARAPLAFHSLYPNPSAGPVSLVLDSDRAGEVSIRIYNVAGQLVLTRRATVAGGRNTVVIDDGGRLGSGVYFVHAVARGRATARKLHILR